MKTRSFLSILFFVSVVYSLNAQNFQGREAEKLISGSSYVKLNEVSSAPEFVQLKKGKEISVSEFPLWLKKTFGLSDQISPIKLKEETDEIGMRHIRYQISNNGILVFGAFINTHGTDEWISSINGRMPAQVVSKSQLVSEDNALESAKQHIGAQSYKWELPSEEQHLKWESDDPRATYFPKGELVYIDPSFSFNDSARFRLAYKFDIYAHQPVYRAEVFVDAETGEVLFENHRIHIADAVGTAQTGYSGTKTITTDSFGGSFRLREAGRGNGIRTFDMNTGTNYGNAVDFTDGDNNWNNVNAQYDQYATDAHWGAEMTYDYFLIRHGRNGINGNNMQINSYVHYDVAYFNAFWDGSRMTYGDGNGNPLTALDICGHEMTHGVTENSAGLVYQNESGALNESFSDIFGAAVEWVQNPSSGDWLIGENVGTLRSMSNPPAYGDPDTYNGINWATGTGDNGGVHTNSGVQNKWFYILTQGENGTNDLGNPYSVTGIGLTDAAAIAYRNLTVYLGPSSNYADARFYAIRSAIDLFGGCSPQVIACTNAWYAVGVGGLFNASVVGDFTAAITSSCQAPFTASFTNLSTNGSSFLWNFGDGTTSTATNPTHTYSSNGLYTVTLFVDGGNCGDDTEVRNNYISVNPNNPCVSVMPNSGTRTLTWCTGTLYDNGGPTGNYTDQTTATTTISPPGATSVTLNFSSFSFEAGYDYLYIYNGPTTASPLLGQYDGTNLPNGGTVSSTGGSITIRQTSDQSVTGSGFALTWQCVQPNAVPSANFMGSPRVSCNGQVNFSDLSINGATSWLWDFGDGTTSTAQNPSHTYADEGTYTVVLTASNNFGSHIISQNNYITIDRPAGPSAAPVFSCSTGSVALSASGNGTLNWYNQASAGSILGTGPTFNTPSISSTTTFYVEEVVAPITYNMGPANNTFGTGGNFTGDQHLLFNASTAFTLKTVRVYAEGAGNRTIQLRNSSGTVLQSATVNLANGSQVVTLNFSIQPGTNYQLGTTATPNLYRNNAGPSYPYTIANVASITSSSAGTGYYYFFYDWVIETPGCTSERTAVVAEIANPPSAQGASRCGTGTVGLSAAGSGTLNWFSTPSGGNPLSTGPIFTTPSIATTTSYFVESVIQPTALYGGPPTNVFGTGGNFNNIQSLLFDSYENSTLVSVKVYAQGAGNRTIQLRNAGGTVLQSAIVNIPAGESRVTLNFDLPIANGLQLGTSAGPNLYRNNTGASYPYNIPGLLSITSSTAGNDYYYFFYDWEVQIDGCSTARTEVIATVGPSPSVSIVGAQQVCEGQPLSLTTTATNVDSYSWSTGETTADISVSPSTTSTFSVVASNSCGQASDQITVNVSPLPSVSISGATQVCAGQSLSLTTNASNVDSYAWSTGQTTADISVSPSTTSTYSVNATNSCGEATGQITVDVNPLPTVIIDGPSSVCEGESILLTSIASNAVSYLWSPDGQTSASITINPNIQTDYSVTASNSCGQATDEITVNVNPLPIVSISGATQVCAGQSLSLTTNASNVDSYAWSTGQTTADISVSPSTTSTYSVNATNSCGEATDQITVDVNPLPTVIIDGPSSVCEGETVLLTSSASNAVSYLWSPDGQTSANITVNPNIQTDYSVTASNSCGDAVGQFSMDVNPLPTITVSLDQEICVGETVQISATSNGSIQWVPNGESSASIDVSPTENTVYSATATNSCGNISAAVNVVVYQLPAVPTISLNGTSLESSSSTSYQWYLDGILIQDATSSSYSPTESGNYSVEVTDGNGCSAISEEYSWITVGIAEFGRRLDVYPNPFAERLIISSDINIEFIDVIDAEGRVILAKNFQAQELQLNTSTWANGIYTLKIRSEKGPSMMKVVRID